MKEQLNIDKIFKISPDVITREIEGELILVPLVAGIGDVDDELFTLNDTGRFIWEKLDGSNSLESILNLLKDEFDAEFEELRQDLMGFVGELVKRRMVIDI